MMRCVSIRAKLLANLRPKTCIWFVLIVGIVIRFSSLSSLGADNILVLQILGEAKAKSELRPVLPLLDLLTSLTQGNTVEYAPNVRAMEELVRARKIHVARLRGTVLLALGYFDESVFSLERADTSPMTLYLLATAYAFHQDIERAVSTLLSVSDVSQSLFNAGMQAHTQGIYSNSTKWLTWALQSSGIAEINKPIAYRTISQGYLRLNDLANAIDWARRWGEDVPDDLDAVAWLAAILLWQGQPEAAYGVWERIDPVVAEQQQDYASQMGQIYETRGDWVKALRFYQLSWKINQGRASVAPDIAWSLSMALAHVGQAEQALPYLEFVIRSGRTDLQQRARDFLLELRTNSQR